MTSSHSWTQTFSSGAAPRGGPTSDHRPCATAGQSPPGRGRCHTPRCSAPRPPARADQHQQVRAGVVQFCLSLTKERSLLSMRHRHPLVADKPL